MHLDITSDVYRIYDVNVAHGLYLRNKYNYDELSIMKHQNIQEACSTPGYKLPVIIKRFFERCGYCFKFINMLSTDPCKHCPLDICIDENDIDNFKVVTTKKYFKKLHKSWYKNTFGVNL